MSWLLVILLYAPDLTTPVRVERVFATERQCLAERDHLWQQALPAEFAGRLILWCEGRT